MIDPDKIDESEVDQLIEELSDIVVRRHLETPAIMFLEMNKPLGFIASQSVIVASPFLAPIFGIERMGRLSKLLSSSERIDKLINAIEEKAGRKNRPAESDNTQGAQA